MILEIDATIVNWLLAQVCMREECHSKQKSRGTTLLYYFLLCLFGTSIRLISLVTKSHQPCRAHQGYLIFNILNVLSSTDNLSFCSDACLKALAISYRPVDFIFNKDEMSHSPMGKAVPGAYGGRLLMATLEQL